MNGERDTAGRVLDGRSLLPLARDPALGAGRPVLVEVAKGAGMLTTAIRTRRWMYAEHASGATELYDMTADPRQLRSLHASPALAPLRAALARRLAALLRRFGLPVALPAGLDVDGLLPRMKLDKKARSGAVRLVLWAGIGRAEVVDGVPDAVLRALPVR